MTITVAEICRHPVKGLNAEALARVALTPGEGLPHDRRFALALGSTNFATRAPEWRPKTQFLMLMRDEKLAQLRVTFDEASGDLAIGHLDMGVYAEAVTGGQVATGDRIVVPARGV